MSRDKNMADVPNTNPFLDDDDEERTVIAVTEENDVGLQAAKTYEHHEISLDALAGSLLKENFVLTALEFHTELLETGREIPRLRDYFSNPGNFERTKDEFGTASLRKYLFELSMLNLTMAEVSSILSVSCLSKRCRRANRQIRTNRSRAFYLNHCMKMDRSITYDIQRVTFKAKNARKLGIL